MSDEAWLEGAISVAAALSGRSRDVQAVLLRQDRSDESHRRIAQLARAAGVPVRHVPAPEIEAQAGGTSHGGILAQVGPRRFAALEDLLPGAGTPFIVMIDGVEDPFNFGSAVRSLYAAGADGLVVRPRNWMSAAATVVRASAGASELIPTAVAETAQDAAAFFQAHGLAVACATDAPGSVSLYEADLRVPLFLLIGGEKRGITRSFEARADLRLRIPYGRPRAHALGTAAAAAVLGFEILRQRRS